MKLLKNIYKYWLLFSHYLGLVQSFLILFLFYYLVITPVGFLRRIFVFDNLDREFPKSGESYRKTAENISASEFGF